MAGEPRDVAVIRAAAGWLRRHPRRLLGRAALAGLALWLVTGVHTVGNGESAVRVRCGRLLGETLGPGLHFSLPAGLDRLAKVRTGEVRRLEVTGGQGQPFALVTGDENLMEATLVVQYKVTSAGPFLFHAEDAAALLEQAVRSALVSSVVQMPVDGLLTSGKARIQTEVRGKAQATLQAYGLGVSLVSVSLQTAAPPPEAAEAFRQVSDARAEAARAVSEAEGRRERALSLARGEAAGLLQEARSGAAARLQKARGAAARFDQILVQARRSPGQTRTDFYLETLRKVLPRTEIIVLAPGEKPRIDVHLTPPREGGRSEAP